MNCAGFGVETYSLYTIGALALEDAEQVLAHLNQGCSTCRAGIRDSVSFWHTYALGTAPSASPPAGLRERVIRSVRPLVSMPRRSLSMVPMWARVAAACTALGVWSAVLWLEGSHYSRQQVPTAQVSVPRNTPPAAEDASRRQLAEALRSAADLRASLTGLTARLDEAERGARLARTQNEEQDRALAALRLQSTNTADALARSEARAQQLDQQIRQNNQQHADAVARLEQARQDAETRYRGSESERSRAQADRDRLASQVADLTAKNQDLDRQLVEVRAVLERQRQSVGPLLQLAGIVGTPGLKAIPLRGTSRDPAASGTAFVVEGASVLVYFSNLPALPAHRTYQLWLMRRHSPGIVSGGIFTPDSQKRAFLRFNGSAVTTGVTALAVTDEPAGGSPGPTGHKFLIGTPSPS